MASEQDTIKVTKNDLPVSCPPKDSPAWNMHPRVFIELSGEKGASCPYCGTNFELVQD